MNNTTFYICTHKEFEIPQDTKGNYKIITGGTELGNTYPYPQGLSVKVRPNPKRVLINNSL